MNQPGCMAGHRGGAPVRAVCYFDVRPGRQADFLRRCREMGVLADLERHPGFVSGELCQATDGSSLVALTTLWSSRAAYRSWQRRGPKLPDPSCPHGGCEEPASGDALEVVHQLRPIGGPAAVAA